LIPLIYTEALPKTMMATMLTAPPPSASPPPPSAAVQVVHVKPQAHLMDAGKLMAPKVIPKDIKIIKEDAEPDMSAGMQGGVPGGVAGGSMGGVLGGVMVHGRSAATAKAEADWSAPRRRQRSGPRASSTVSSRSIRRCPPDPQSPAPCACTHYRQGRHHPAARSHERPSRCSNRPRWTPCVNGVINRLCSMAIPWKSTPPLT